MEMNHLQNSWKYFFKATFDPANLPFLNQAMCQQLPLTASATVPCNLNWLCWDPGGNTQTALPNRVLQLSSLQGGAWSTKNQSKFPQSAGVDKTATAEKPHGYNKTAPLRHSKFLFILYLSVEWQPSSKQWQQALYKAEGKKGQPFMFGSQCWITSFFPGSEGQRSLVWLSLPHIPHLSVLACCFFGVQKKHPYLNCFHSKS